MARVERPWEVQCAGKVRHPSKSAAKRAARQQGLHHRLHPYKCSWCGWFHLGAPVFGVKPGLPADETVKRRREARLARAVARSEQDEKIVVRGRAW